MEALLQRHQRLRPATKSVLRADAAALLGQAVHQPRDVRLRLHHRDTKAEVEHQRHLRPPLSRQELHLHHSVGLSFRSNRQTSIHFAQFNSFN